MEGSKGGPAEQGKKESLGGKTAQQKTWRWLGWRAPGTLEDSRWRRPRMGEVGTETWGCHPITPAGHPAHPSTGRSLMRSLLLVSCLCPRQGLSATIAEAPLPFPLESVIPGKVNANVPPASGLLTEDRKTSVGLLPPWWQDPNACHSTVPAPV